MLDTGYRISDLSNIPVINGECGIKGKIALENTYFLAYSHSVYGINYNKQNYKVPLVSLRDDIKAYLGVSSLNGPWAQGVKFWHGDWENKTEYNKSYIWLWTEDYEKHEHYNPEKFSDLDNSYFIINNPPYPFESAELNNRENGEAAAELLEDGTVSSINLPIAAADPCVDSNKIVTKKYIDERVASQRIVILDNLSFTLRDYPCTYIIKESVLKKAIEDIALTDENGNILSTDTDDLYIEIKCPESLEQRVLHNQIHFSILLEGSDSGDGDNNWNTPIDKNIKWRIISSNNEERNIAWIGEPPLMGEAGNYLYGSSRYAIVNFKTITNKIDHQEIYENYEGEDTRVGYNLIPDIIFSAICENSFYKSSGINKINNFIGSSAIIKSTDGSVDITTKLIEDSIIDIDLSVSSVASKRIVSADENITIEETENEWLLSLNSDISSGDVHLEGDEYIKTSKNNNGWNISLDTSKIGASYITPIPESNEIKLSESYTKTYWSNTSNQRITFNTEGLKENETINITLLYKTSEDTSINSSISWAMSPSGSSPVFKANRLYSIGLRYIPPVAGFNSEGTILGRVEWFKYL